MRVPIELTPLGWKAEPIRVEVDTDATIGQLIAKFKAAAMHEVYKSFRHGVIVLINEGSEPAHFSLSGTITTASCAPSRFAHWFARIPKVLCCFNW